MKYFILCSVKYFVLINIILYLGTLFVSGDFEFSFMTNVVVPVLCAYAEIEDQRRNQAAVYDQLNNAVKGKE